MVANTSNLERLRVMREGHGRYVLKLDQELTEILQGEDEDYERLNVMRQLLHRKEGSLSEINPEILSLCLNSVLELGAAAQAIQLNRSELRRSCQNYSQNVWRVPNKLSGQIWISFSRFRHVPMIARPVFDSASTRSNLCSFPPLDVARRNFGSIRK